MWSFIKLMVWGLVWTPAWVLTTIIRHIAKKPRLDNCLSWALRRWDEEGGYLVIRWCRSSKIGWFRWPHFLWLPIDKHEELRHFIPRSEDQEMQFFPDAWFEGKIQRGDSEDNLEN